MHAEQLVEDAVYELADKAPSETVAQLLEIAANINTVALEIEKSQARLQ